MKCFSCQKTVEAEQISFREECPFCRADLHVCRNCRFYDRGAYHECRETSADYVADKERANRCEYFRFDQETEKSKQTDTRSKLEDLFRKA